MTREEAMRKVQMYDFALDDTALFLDTHPDNKAALMFFADTRKRYMEAMEAYQMEFGPLTAEATNVENGWTWVDTPWPWEMED